MLRSALAAITVAIVAPTAFADIKEEIDIEVTIDRSAVTSPASARAALADIVDQVREACSYTTAGSRIARIDETCVAEGVEKVVAEINAGALTAVFADTRTLAYVEPKEVRYASIN